MSLKSELIICLLINSICIHECVRGDSFSADTTTDKLRRGKRQQVYSFKFSYIWTRQVTFKLENAETIDRNIYLYTYLHSLLRRVEADKTIVIQTNEAFSSSRASCGPALPHVHQLHALTVGPRPGHSHLALQGKRSLTHHTLPLPHTLACMLAHTRLTAGARWDASCCRSGKGVHWMGSTGQLHTDRSLAFPESSTPSPTLISLPLQAYWELRGAHVARDYQHHYCSHAAQNLLGYI